MIRGSVEIKGGASALAREVRAANAAALVAEARRWFTEVLPLHFTVQGGRTWHYARRARRYLERKERRFHHQNPLEFTGKAKRQICSWFDPRPLRNAIEIRLHAPRYFFQYKLGGTDKVKEVTRVNKQEMRDMARRFGTLAGQRMSTRAAAYREVVNF